MCCRSTISCDCTRLCTKPTKAEGDSRLHTIRVRAGLSQSGLARRSGVTLRSIQMYEQRRKDLGKAAVSTVLALARTLGCRIEDLLEP